MVLGWLLGLWLGFCIRRSSYVSKIFKSSDGVKCRLGEGGSLSFGFVMGVLFSFIVYFLVADRGCVVVVNRKGSNEKMYGLVQLLDDLYGGSLDGLPRSSAEAVYDGVSSSIDSRFMTSKSKARGILDAIQAQVDRDTGDMVDRGGADIVSIFDALKVDLVRDVRGMVDKQRLSSEKVSRYFGQTIKNIIGTLLKELQVGEQDVGVLQDIHWRFHQNDVHGTRGVLRVANHVYGAGDFDLFFAKVQDVLDSKLVVGCLARARLVERENCGSFRVSCSGRDDLLKSIGLEVSKKDEACALWELAHVVRSKDRIIGLRHRWMKSSNDASARKLVAEAVVRDVIFPRMWLVPTP
uniref:Uncharacterized protein n=1 Tax=Mucochytrium quahogii TaxID=96639 RepID=A0A7S2S0S5_9STRA|mmetsp:Transcript_22981/g.50083  ORF Transcript_22981/g.50083 Transcript_22981/m.50083 type:complete len:351 (+) Transcript_22981:1181-2233(+)